MTAGGKVNAYAAQAFADFILDWLVRNRHRFAPQDQRANLQLAAAALQTATTGPYNPAHSNPDHEAEGGSATGVFACFHRVSHTTAIMHAGSIGDSALIVVHLRQSVARQLNPVHRKHDKDTGGQLTMCIGIDGPVWVVSREITTDEILVLSTDGLTDNLHLPELDRIIPLIISARVFDGIVPFACSEIPARKPSLAYLQQVCKGDLEPLTLVSCRVAGLRLFNYVEWVTRDFFKQEEVYYDLCLQMNALQRDGLATGEDQAEKLAGMQAQAEEMSRARKAVAKTAKTDDAMIMVLQPFNRL